MILPIAAQIHIGERIIPAISIPDCGHFIGSTRDLQPESPGGPNG